MHHLSFSRTIRQLNDTTSGALYESCVQDVAGQTCDSVAQVTQRFFASHKT